MNEQAKEATELKFTDDCTIYKINEIFENISNAMDKESTINIDLSDVGKIDSSFIQLLVMAQLEAKNRGGGINIKDDSGAVYEFAHNICCDLHQPIMNGDIENVT